MSIGTVALEVGVQTPTSGRVIHAPCPKKPERVRETGHSLSLRDNILVLTDREVEWRGNGGLYRRFTTPATPLDAALVAFHTFEPGVPVLCILIEELLLIGTQGTILLPVQVSPHHVDASLFVFL